MEDPNKRGGIKLIDEEGFPRLDVIMEAIDFLMNESEPPQGPFQVPLDDKVSHRDTKTSPDTHPKDNNKNKIPIRNNVSLNYIRVRIEDVGVQALIDTGVRMSMVGPNIYEDIMGVTDIASSANKLKLKLIVGGITRELLVLALSDMHEENIILGIDFCQKFNFDCQFETNQWRVDNGEWNMFEKTEKNTGLSTDSTSEQAETASTNCEQKEDKKYDFTCDLI